MNNNFRELRTEEKETLIARQCTAESWKNIKVAEDFSPLLLYGCRFVGRVSIGNNVRIINSTIKNYVIGDNTVIDSVSRLECRHRSAFGNGVGVSTMNECGGRTVKIYADMTAQIAYLSAVYRHRPRLVEAINAMVDRYVESHSSEMGQIGENCQLIGSRFIREVRIGDGVVSAGASLLENCASWQCLTAGLVLKA